MPYQSNLLEGTQTFGVSTNWPAKLVSLELSRVMKHETWAVDFLIIYLILRKSL